MVASKVVLRRRNEDGKEGALKQEMETILCPRDNGSSSSNLVFVLH